MRLIRSGLKARVFQEDGKVYRPEVIQGGILSPLLSNIYLHELDIYMEKLMIEEFNQGPRTSKNQRINPVANKLLKANKKNEYYRLKIPHKMYNDPEYRNCKYIRYADDFIVGILGPRKMAAEISTLR